MLKPVDELVLIIMVSLFVVPVCCWAYALISLLVRFFRSIGGHTVNGNHSRVRRSVYALFNHRIRA